MNDHGKDFNGGVFHFEHGEPSSVKPVAGDVLIYTADSRNIHSVDEVLDGERITLTLWFTRNSAHDEDAKLISSLSQSISRCEVEVPDPYLPLPASDNMYWFSDNHLGFDVRYARMHTLGFRICSSTNEQNVQPNSLHDSCELLGKPLQLGRDDETFDKEFANSLHALQVVQFYYWKGPSLAAIRSNMRSGRPTAIKKMSGSDMVICCSQQLMEKIFGHISHDDLEHSFSWDDFAIAVEMWEEYTRSLHRRMLLLLPYWVSHHSIVLVDSSELQKCDRLPN